MTKEERILIIDDVNDNIQIVASILNKDGYKLNYATSGEKALKYAENNKFDLILLDIMMPEMNGFDVCRELKKNAATSEIPVIFLTAKDDIDSISTAFEIGGVDYITKPFNKTELLARVKTHLNLKNANEQLKQNIKARDKFFSIIAHDLKNPFSTLIGFASVLIEEFDTLSTDNLKEYHKYIYELSKKSFSLLENLLEWARSQMGQMIITPRKFKFKEIVDDTIELLIEDAERKNIHLSSKIDDSCEIFADPDTITVIIRNLIANAVKFTPLDGDITVSAKCFNNFTEISVSDTGVGLSEEDMDRLFRLDVNPALIGSGTGKGTGLGLILCREFIKKNGGTIRVESELNKGCNFIFTLPSSDKN